MYSNHRGQLGPGGWPALAERTGGPANVKSLALDRDVPVGPFNRALAEVCAAEACDAHEVGRRAAERWASMYRALVAELQGRPERMVALFCQEVYPWFVNRARAARVVDEGPQHHLVEFADGLDPGFRAGLLEGMVALTGTPARVRQLDATTYDVRWEPVEGPRPSVAAVLARATRARLLPITLAPVVVGTALAWWQGVADPILAAAALVAAAALHFAANTLNDVLDHRRGVDAANLTPTPFGGGSRVLQRGLVSPRGMLGLTLALATVGIALGLALALAGGTPVLVLGAMGVALGYAYTGSPFRLAHRGLGELTALAVFGPLVTAGAFAVQAGTVTPLALVVGAPIGLVMAAFLLVSELPDAPWDARTGKRTLVVRVGAKGEALVAATLASPFALVAGLVACDVLPLATLVMLVAAPAALALGRQVADARRDPERLARLQPRVLLLHAATALLLAVGLGLEALA